MGRLSEERKRKVVAAYFEEEKEPEEIAVQMRLAERTVRNVLSDRELLEPYRKRSEAAKLRAQICVNESAEEAARRQAQLLRGEETQERVRQQAAKDILDRAGVRVPKEEKRDIRITFAGGMPKLGMPISCSMMRARAGRSVPIIIGIGVPARAMKRGCRLAAASSTSWISFSSASPVRAWISSRAEI